MASRNTFDVHTPVALPYLVAEGLLPENPGNDLYHQETYGRSEDGQAISEEQLLWTQHCVVWSQGSVIRNVYRFELEGEQVAQALLTRFGSASTNGSHARTAVDSGNDINRGYGSKTQSRSSSAGQAYTASVERAVVVLLKSKAHIYFLQGSDHIVDLPFEVERAFAASRGLVLQKKAAAPPSLPSTPQLPTAPPNSFFSSQLQPSSSYLQSPTLLKSFAASQPYRPSPLAAGNNRLEALFQHVFGTPDPGANEDIATLYSLTSPLSDFGVVTYSLQHHRPRAFNKAQAGLSVEFEALDVAERIIYVSPCDELGDDRSADRGSLTLLVTVNSETRTLTIWHAWYIGEQSLASLLKERAAHKAAKAKRRSSFMSANVATGTTTPAVRARDGARESFAAGSMRLPGDAGHGHAGVSTRKSTRQEEETEMVHQMDPDFQPTSSHPNKRESRRISSMNADARAIPNTGTSFATAGGRRNTSFGGTGERRSTGHRKSRGSIPGSVFGRSLGLEDDLMELDSSFDVDNEENVDAIVRHIRATHEAAAADGTFGGMDDSYKREMVVQKIHSVAVSLNTQQERPPFQVLTLRDPVPSRIEGTHRLGVYVRDGTTNDLTCLQLSVRHRALWAKSPHKTMVAIPTFLGDVKLGRCGDMTKLKRGSALSVSCDQGVSISPIAPLLCPIPKATRSIPSGQMVNRLIQVCQLVLPSLQAQMMTGIWMLAHAKLLEGSQHLESTNADAEMVAFATAVFVLTGHLAGPRGRTASMSKAVSQDAASDRPSTQADYHRRLLRQATNGPWSSLGKAQDLDVAPYYGTRQGDKCLPLAAQLANELSQTVPWLSASGPLQLSADEVISLMLALHIFAQEQKLCVLSSSSSNASFVAALTAQLGTLLGLRAWSHHGENPHLDGADSRRWAFVDSAGGPPPQVLLMEEPVSVYMWFGHAMKFRSTERYPSLSDVASLNLGTITGKKHASTAAKLTPRVLSIADVLEATSCFTTTPFRTVELMSQHGIDQDVLESLPGAIAAPFREAIVRCEREPSTAWPPSLLRIVGRDDLDLDGVKSGSSATRAPFKAVSQSPRDAHAICNALDQQPHAAKTKEASRHAVSQLIFSEDRRLVEATSLMHYNSPQVAECPKQPDWTDAHHFEQQRRVLQWVITRMIALPAGDGMMHFDSQTPLLTEKYHLSGFSNACVMQPMGHTLTADRSGLTEEKVNWAYFHAGVAAGLRIAKSTKGIDTSWIAFNKPHDLTNRHAGLLLALGLRGHLRHLAKWLSFKYLTPKHTVTSIGLLLGLSASYMGTMDGLITRMLSVHITRMLPPGAAELNVSATTQTAGLMGIGLLYYNTQHRRMSEIMLSEIEHMELEDPDSGPDLLRDESYRLAAGFALGYINLGKGRDLRGLSGMHLPERLLATAVGSRPVSAVHVFDRATAGAVIGIVLVYMKSEDRSIARKIDIPDTEAQFDHVRPDMLMLRAMAKHVILWNDIVTGGLASGGASSFVQSNLPPCYQSRFRISSTSRPPLKSADVPFFNIVTGLVLALSLKYAGSGDEVARDEILTVLDYFYKAKGSGDASFYYDAKLTRSTVRRCIDVVALAASTVMAGTGDLKTFRYLRRLHGRTDPETPYGSHLAAHLAIGVLFLGGGTYTLGTSDLAVASLLCAFYPLYPTDVHNNHVHLQAFRHFWVFAAEARCLVVEDIDTQRPIAMPIVVTLKDGSTKNLTSPCLLPELDSIASVHTNDPSYWRVTLDFANNPTHLAHFKETQRVSVRRCPPSEAHNTIFTATMAALQPSSSPSAPTGWQTIFDLPGFRDIDKAETELILPPNPLSSVHTDEHGTSVDDRLLLARAAGSEDRDALWNLRMLFAWAEKAREEGDGGLRWMGEEVLEGLRARIEERMQRGGAA